MERGDELSLPVSNELEIGRAGEHLVCCDLIKQGYVAYMAPAGLPYDVIVDISGRIIKIQVKTTQEPKDFPKQKRIYRYSTRRAKGSRVRYDINSVDYFAFVALDIMTVAYVPIDQMVTQRGTIKQTRDFRSTKHPYEGRVYSNGTVRKLDWGLVLENFGEFHG